MAETTERTEKATPRRREEARRRGQVVLSPEVSPVVVLLTVLAVASAGAPGVLAQSRALFADWLAAIGPTIAHDRPAGPLLLRAALVVGSWLVPFLLLTGAMGVAAVIAQVGWAPTPELLKPDLARVSPGRGFQRIFSVQGAFVLGKSIVKIVVVLVLAYHTIGGTLGATLATPAMAPGDILTVAGTGLAHLLLVAAIALGVLGAIDYAWQRWRFEQGLRMSRHEVKEEHRETEGDPQIRGRFRRAHRELSKRRMLAEVARADVVLTNPVHVAVALRYRGTEGAAPRVLAKGAGELCERIKEAARTAGVPIVERRALARALYRMVEVGTEIPPALYRAVAEILAYIFSLGGRTPLEAE